MSEDRSFEADVKINRFKLDEECEKQSSLYHYWAEQLAHARSAVDTAEELAKLAKDDTDIVKSKIELKIREEGVEGLKMTEAVVSAAVSTHPEVIEAQADYRKAREEVNQARAKMYELEAGVKAMEHRKAECGDLVQLWVKGYYSAPFVGSPETDEDKHSEQARQRLNRKTRTEEEE